MSYLRDSDREALRLAHDLREEMRVWLANRGVNAPLSVSPFVDPGGQPSVLVTMSADVARALSSMLADQRGQAAGRPGPDTGFQRRMTDTGANPAVSDTGGFRSVNDTGSIPAVSDTGGFRSMNDTGGFRQVPGDGMPPSQPNGTGAFPQPVNGTGGFPQPVNGTGGFPRPVNGAAAFPQVADAAFRPPYQQAAPPPHR